MVKREITIIIYIFKMHYLFFVLPPAIFALAVAGRFTDSFDPYVFLSLIGFWVLVFPATSLMQQIGSLQQQELFISLPISPFLYGVINPVLLSLIYSLLFEVALCITLKGEMKLDEINHIIAASFPSACLLMLMTTTLIALFKNSAIGICLALFYLFFGLFTNGAGQGPFYLMQWYRPRLGTDAHEFILYHYAAIIFLCVLSYYILKFRERFHILKME